MRDEFNSIQFTSISDSTPYSINRISFYFSSHSIFIFQILCVHGGISEPPPAGASLVDAAGRLLYVDRLDDLNRVPCPLSLEKEEDSPAVWQLVWNDPIRFIFLQFLSISAFRSFQIFIFLLLLLS